MKLPNKQYAYRHAAVAADNVECSKAGRNILRKGGSAVDAAIATTLCVGVINMHSTGIGGGGFMMVYDSDKRSAEVIDFRETAPEKSGVDLFKGDPLNGIRGNVEWCVCTTRNRCILISVHDELSYNLLYEPYYWKSIVVYGRCICSSRSCYFGYGTMTLNDKDT